MNETMTVKLRRIENDQIKVFTNIHTISTSDSMICLEKDGELKQFDKNYWEVKESSVDNCVSEVSVDDWVLYIDENTSTVSEGKVVDTHNNEVTVKTLPDGWNVTIHISDILKREENK